MSLPVYLAMTGAEIARCQAFPEKIGWMACHFSAYGTGLSNIPRELPKGSLLIVNDRTPVSGHDPELVCRQLAQAAAETECDAVLLDLQRPDHHQTAAIAKAIVGALPCPVGITEHYAKGLDCPVFLSPPMHQPLEHFLAHWKGREVWLELALSSQTITLTDSGCHYGPLVPAEPPERFFEEPNLCCRYHTKVMESQIEFTLFRTPESLEALLKKAEGLGIPRAIGLYQELGTSL